jgi:dihydropteroate synthase
MSAVILDRAGKPLDMSDPHVMGILNVTPDSFSDGGQFLVKDKAIL